MGMRLWGRRLTSEPRDPQEARNLSSQLPPPGPTRGARGLEPGEGAGESTRSPQPLTGQTREALGRRGPQVGAGPAAPPERRRGRGSQPRGATGAQLCSAPVAACNAGRQTPEIYCLNSGELKSKSRCGPAVPLQRPLPCSWLPGDTLPVISVPVATVPSPCKSLPGAPSSHKSISPWARALIQGDPLT